MGHTIVIVQGTLSGPGMTGHAIVNLPDPSVSGQGMVNCLKTVISSKHFVIQSVGLHDEINSIIVIVGLCSLSEQG